MPIYKTNITLRIHDRPTLRFMAHCLTHWRDVDVCTDEHVEAMKTLIRSVFVLPPAMELVGIQFEDQTLAMVHPDETHTFYVLTLQPSGAWTAARVRIEGFDPCWGVVDAGFWEGLDMAECSMLRAESKGPAEDASGGSRP